MLPPQKKPGRPPGIETSKVSITTQSLDSPPSPPSWGVLEQSQPAQAHSYGGFLHGEGKGGKTFFIPTFLPPPSGKQASILTNEEVPGRNTQKDPVFLPCLSLEALTPVEGQGPSGDFLGLIWGILMPFLLPRRDNQGGRASTLGTKRSGSGVCPK